MTLRYLSSTLLFFCSLVTFAQSVNPLTGQLQYSVPIGSLSANDVSVPITLYHSGQSVGVAEGENDCGVGWGLSVGGSVTRVVRGLPDEINTPTRRGWLANSGSNATNVQNFVPQAPDDLSSCALEATDWNNLNALHSNFSNDTEPDLFYVNAPGLSLQFVFGPDGQPRLLVHQDVTIQFSPLTTPNQITVTNNLGVTFTFGGSGPGLVDQTTRAGYPGGQVSLCDYYSPELTFNSRWKLASISSSATGTTASFNYTPGQLSASRQLFRADSTLSSNYIQDTYTTSSLSSITLKSFQASFFWTDNLLSKVVILESQTQDRRVTEFQYQTATSGKINRAFLKRVKQNDGSCLSAEAQEFEYYDVSESVPTVPTYINWEKSKGMDFFGHPNAVANNWNRTTLYFSPSANDGSRLRVHPLTGAQVINGDNRQPNASSSLFGALKKVKYVTGGYTEIQYEPNTFLDVTVTPQVEYPAGGVRVKKIVGQGSEVAFGKSFEAVSEFRAVTREYEYKLGNGATSGRLLAPVKLGIIGHNAILPLVNNMGDPPTVLYSRVVERIPGKGYTLYEYNVPGVFPEFINGDWKATRSRIARRPAPNCVAPGNLKSGFYLYPYPPSTNFEYKRGTISRVATFSETNGLINEKVILYTTRSQNPLTIKGLRFDRFDGVFHYGIYEMLTGRMDVISQETVREASRSDSSRVLETVTTYAYNTNHTVASVTTTLPNSTTVVKSFKYARDFPFSNPAGSDWVAVAIKALNTNGRGNELIEQSTVTTQPGIPAVTAASLVLYKDFGNNRVLPHEQKTLPPGAAFAAASMSGQTLSTSPNYELTQTLVYDGEGRVLTATDNKKNIVGTHYSTGNSMPVATFSRAKAEECVFEGFEGSSSFGLSTSGTGFAAEAGWTGEKAISFSNTSGALVSSSTNQIQKNGSTYRVSVWVYAASDRSITFNARSGSTVATLTLSNTINNKWNYLEGTLNVTALPASFTLEVKTNASSTSKVTVDDIVFVPLASRVVLQTALPFKGITSTTDDRGHSGKTVYDHMGRAVASFDRARNLTSRTEYAYRFLPPITHSLSFTSSTEQYQIGVPITFTPLSWDCDPALSFVWRVNGSVVANGPGNTMTVTFNTLGNHTVELTSTSSVYGSTTMARTICVEYYFAGPIPYTVTDNNGQPAGLTLDCNSGPRTIAFSIPTVPAGCVVQLGSWLRNGNVVSAGSASISVAPTGSGQTDVYTMFVRIDCSAVKSCAPIENVPYSATVSFSVVNVFNPNCQ